MRVYCVKGRYEEHVGLSRRLSSEPGSHHSSPFLHDSYSKLQAVSFRCLVLMSLAMVSLAERVSPSLLIRPDPQQSSRGGGGRRWV